MKFRRDEGFTLVELMVVVLIIGILVAIAIPVFNTARASAWQRSCHANQRTIEGAAQTFQADTGALPATVGALIPAYVKVAPTCPRPLSGASGGYALTATLDTVADCTVGTATDGAAAHGHYTD